MNADAAPALEVRNVRVGFSRGRRKPTFWVLDDVTLSVAEGRTMGLVGESGSGKSTLARAVLGLVPVQSGSISLQGREITGLGGAARRRLGRQLQAVFQDPNTSLNPSYTVRRSLAEPMRAQGLGSRRQVARDIAKMLTDVGMDPAASGRYPRDFSGGQRQRLSIARALMTRPRVVVCDESVSALDLSVQAQILNLLSDLQEEHGLSYLFISHDMSVVRHVCHDVTVLHAGQVMETGRTTLVTGDPAHPYTRTLLLAAPVADPELQRRRREANVAVGPLQVGPATRTSQGCPFAPRCPFARERCWDTRPPLQQLPDGRAVACHRYPEWKADDSANTPPPPTDDVKDGRDDHH